MGGGGGGGGGRTRRGWWKGGGRDKYSPVSVTQFLLSQHKLQKLITCCLLFLAVLADVMGHSNLLPLESGPTHSWKCALLKLQRPGLAKRDWKLARFCLATPPPA